jgi:PadR family transcriptional regulator, regulatory protein PadR
MDTGDTRLVRDGLGDFERRVLLAVLHLQGRGYAVSIADEIDHRFGKPVSLGAVYATVDRLEKKRFITSRLGDPTPERGGKPKRFYEIEAPGRRAVMQAQETEARLWIGVPPIGAPV